MSYCVNPACPHPQNPPHATLCVSCETALRLQNRYRATQLLREGGFGRTFLAVDEQNPGAVLVIKQYLPVETGMEGGAENSTLEKAIEVFNQDAKRQQAISEHPQIPTVLTYFEQDSRLYVVQEFIEGPSLLEQMERHGPFDEGKIRILLEQLLPILQFIHERNVIHRDIKPESIRQRVAEATVPASTPALWGGEELVLVDFGISKHLASTGLARTGSTIGTEGYAPPEQIRGGLAYPASDLYSLGVSCIQLLTGEWLDELYDPLTGRWIWRDRLQQKGREVSEGLAQILDKLLEDRVSERYQSAVEAIADLQDILPTPVPPPRVNLQEEAIATAPGVEIPAASLSPNRWRCLHTLSGHVGWVWTVGFAPDGKTLASGSADNTVMIWDLSSGERISTLKGHSDLVLSVTFSPRSPLLASSSRDKNIILWDASRGDRIRTLGGWFSGHSELVNSLTFSPDGSTLASGSWDRKLILWDSSTGKRIRTLRGHSNWVYSVAFSPDGSTLASGSRDTTLMLWNAMTGRPFFTLYSDAGLVNAVAFSPDGKTVASGNFDGTVILWDASKGVQTGTLHGHSERVNSLVYRPDGKMLATASRDRTIVLWDMDSLTPICTLTDHQERVFAVAFSPDGSTLASASGDETIKLWQAP
ncbi:serine/threonine-protein kinase [Phormidium sp. CCY1219]|uniref:serine/threonine-protein kinase n=1 Tax=Phormidium sp. CCY1219 TaxID=2886104 RepID=UPI002D1EF553|nr:serine/threonine-protein kinase [Phormidium sp. CCY1219]MEB3829239.1 serine/threonine protein kinase [Phormidium sp. CCY1219]